ncbi:MAG: ATP-binding protein [Calditrichia bacterium]
MKIFRKIVKSYSTKLTLIIAFTVLCIYLVHSFICASFQQKNLENTILLSTNQTAEFIEKTLNIFMQQNDKENLFNTLQILSEEREIERIDLLNQQGEVVYTNIATGSEDEFNNICISCHSNKSDIIAAQHTHFSFIRPSLDKINRVVQVINPIESSASCYISGCHQGGNIGECLGVLSITVSLQNIDARFFEIKKRVRLMFYILLLISVPLFALIIYFTTYRPLKVLENGIQLISAGDLNHQIEMDRDDEFGMLASSFNNMMTKLKKAYDEIHEWSRTLETRVEEKSKELEELHKNVLKVEKLASLGKLSATVAHELNNPLSGIVTYAKLILRVLEKSDLQQSTKEKVTSQLDIIAREAMRCGNIVKNLLIFARDTSYSPQPVNIQLLLKELADMMDHQLMLNKINFLYQIDSDVNEIIADYEQLKQALLAIIINAQEAMPEGGDLSIHVSRNEKTYQIKISDTGGGIPEDVLPNIFDPFFSTKNKTQGVGLGLSVVYGIIRKHKGNIQVRSELNKGTTFIITIPVSQEE